MQMAVHRTTVIRERPLVWIPFVASNYGDDEESLFFRSFPKSDLSDKYRVFQKELTTVLQMLLCGECYENVYNERRTNYLFKVLND
jgi:hypothetical protein